MEVHKVLGKGHSENVYADALEYEFKRNAIPYEREKKYTIEGAREFIKGNKKAEENFALIDSLKKLKLFLLDLKANL